MPKRGKLGDKSNKNENEKNNYRIYYKFINQ